MFQGISLWAASPKWKAGCGILANIEEEWQPIVCFDTAHGRPHIDISHPDGSQERQELPFDNYNTALSYAIHHVKTRWQFYRERYERWKHG